MNKEFEPGHGVLFMKVGLHAEEEIDQIIERKMEEYRQAGMIFWGYGGNTCHPTNIVQPFAKQYEEMDMPVHIAMHRMNSQHRGKPKLAEEYSDDGFNWQPIPEGIEVRGSRFAIVMGAPEEEDLDLGLDQTVVSVGPSRGRIGSEYIKGQVDKGCFDIVSSDHPGSEGTTKHIDLKARLLPPYAVFLR